MDDHLCATRQTLFSNINFTVVSILTSKSFLQVLGESLHLTTDYIGNEEKVVVANSKLESVEAESSKLKKFLIESMDETNKAKEKIKKLNESLRVEKMLFVQKDEEIQAALLRTSAEREKVVEQFMKSKHFFDLQFIQYYKGFELFRRWMMKHHSQDVDFSNLDFEAVDIEILADEAKEQEETTTTAATGGEDAADAGGVDPSQGDKVVAPSVQ